MQLVTMVTQSQQEVTVMPLLLCSRNEQLRSRVENNLCAAGTARSGACVDAPSMDYKNTFFLYVSS